MAVDDHGLEVLKKSGEEVTPSDKSNYYIKTSSTATNALQYENAGGGIAYLGCAVAGSVTSAAVWQIQRIDTSSGVVIEFADGDPKSDNVWDDRAGLSYS